MTERESETVAVNVTEESAQPRVQAPVTEEEIDFCRQSFAATGEK